MRETLPWRIHIWDYPKGNEAIRTPSPVQGLTGDPGELTPVLGLVSDCSAQSDCRGCLEDSTRVNHPGNWIGGEKGARIPGWGGMVQQAWHQPDLPAYYLLPNTREETAQQGDCRILWRLLVSPERCHALGGGNTPNEVSPHPQGARLALRLVCQGDGFHYPVGQPLFGDSLPFLLTSVAGKVLLRASEAPGAGHVYAQCYYGTQQR